jgi:hypothetical protein
MQGVEDEDGSAMLQRPLTFKEFVIQSILGSREAADTIVDPEERLTEVDPLPPARPSLDSITLALRLPPSL